MFHFLAIDVINSKANHELESKANTTTTAATHSGDMKAAPAATSSPAPTNNNRNVEPANEHYSNSNDISMDNSSNKLSPSESPLSESKGDDQLAEDLSEEDKDSKKVYDRATLMDLRNKASETAFENAHKSNIQDILRKVCVVF